MNRISYLEIVGKEYPLSFSLSASREISRKFGDIEKIMDKIGNGLTDESLESLSFIAAVMIQQGCAYYNIFKKDVPAYANAPIDENGKFIPLTQEEIEVGLALGDLNKFSEILIGAMTNGEKTEVEIETPKKQESDQ